MRTLLAILLVLCFSVPPVHAQLVRSKTSALPQARRPVLLGEDETPVAGVRLARADIKAVVHGNLAQATMILTFANEQARVLGGNLIFPLPEGATVTGYGLEINGRIVDGVAVEKERARLIYESELHKRVDPGLVEHVQGNAFRTRLYPIPARGMRAIKIEYVTQIEQSNKGLTLTLPLDLGEAIDVLSIRIDAPEAIAAPTVLAGGMDSLKFSKVGHGYTAAATAKDGGSTNALVIGFPEMTERSVAVEKRAKFARTIEELERRDRKQEGETGFGAYEYYFAATDSPNIVKRQAEQLNVHRVGVVWDASLSRGASDHARELKLLQSSLERLGNPSTDLIVLRDKLDVRIMFDPGAKGIANLIEAIQKLPYDGATNIGGLTFPRNAADYGAAAKNSVADYDMFLLFTDGFGNLGADRPLRAEVPVYALCDDVRANHALLRSICQESGGNYYNLKRATDDQVLAGMGYGPYNLVSVECKPEEISDVYPPIGTEVGGRFTVSGKLLAPQATLTLNYGFGKQVSVSQTFTISAAGVEEGSLIPRFWAQQKTAALSLFPEKNVEELTRLGKQFNLVTPNTSLLVLESVDQYVQYRVVPPVTQPEIYREFLVKIEEHHAQEVVSQTQKLQQVVAMWNARVQWWEAEHKFPEKLKVNADGLAFGAPATSPTDGAVSRLQTDPRAAAARATEATASSDHPNSPVADARPHPGPGGANGGGQAPARPQQQAEAGRGGLVAEELRHEPGSNLSDISRGDDSKKDAAKGKNGELDLDQIQIAIKSWDPKTPYIAAMKAAAAEKAYDVYLVQRKNYATSPAFYLDSADYLVHIGQEQMGVRVLSNIVELELSDARLLRVAAHRLNQIGEREMAIDLFEKVLKLRPEEPQSYRDLALALADRAEALAAIPAGNTGNPLQENVDRALSDYVRSLELLNKVVLGNWPRFPEVELPVLMEANAIAAKAQRLPGVHDFHNPIDSRLQKNLDLDVRVVMTWDADQTDIDLWVTEPSGEKCFYGHNRTIIGGLLSHDFTDGYGPEEYCLRKLMPGQYTIQANYYGSRQQELTGPATVQATVITNFGRPNEKRQALTLRLKDMKEIVDVGTVTLGGAVEVKPGSAKELNK